MPSAHVDGSPTVTGHDRDLRDLRSAELVDRTDRKPRSSRRSADRGRVGPGHHLSDALVNRLVVRGVQVIRFDHRDTGRSSIIDFDRHPYGLSDLAADTLAILDAYKLPPTHVVGASMGGVIAQWLAVHEPARVRSLTLLSTTPMSHDPGPVWQRAIARQPADPDDLPPPTPRFLQHLADSDGSSGRAVVAGIRPGPRTGLRPTPDPRGHRPASTVQVEAQTHVVNCGHASLALMWRVSLDQTSQDVTIAGQPGGASHLVQGRA
jgi:pimeloyl-ACP methyl ester carboxylesterase